jgi:hypothetical protein
MFDPWIKAGNDRKDLPLALVDDFLQQSWSDVLPNNRQSAQIYPAITQVSVCFGTFTDRPRSADPPLCG